jgi:S1-C subfamily serine protease
MAPVNLLDLLIIILVILAAWAGYRRGAVLQLFAYGGLVLGLLLGILLAPRVASLATDPFTQAMLALGTLVFVPALLDGLGWVIGAHASAATRRILDPIDSVAGTVVGGLVVLLATWLLAFNLIQGPFPVLSRQIRHSAVVRTLDAALPRPPALLAQARRFLERSGFPEVFAGLPPFPAGPVELPSRGEFNRAIRAADQSTGRVSGEACDRIQIGSGFVIEPGYVVTNAHVVAGVDEPIVQFPDGSEFGATAVLFDSDLDVAVLRISGPGPQDLDLRDIDLDRGARGAVLGYPGGGNLTASTAGVRRLMDALGRDIYGRRTVQREVYELQARVRPGNSGGPFVTPQGMVAGVVFAASTTDADVGYALTSSQVDPMIQRALGRTSEVDTGRCIR